MKNQTMRISYNTKPEDLNILVGARISQMYSETTTGRMGYTIMNVNDVVTEVERQKESIRLVFQNESSDVLVRQAMVVYAKEEEPEETTEEETEDERTEEPD